MKVTYDSDFFTNENVERNLIEINKHPQINDFSALRESNFLSLKFERDNSHFYHRQVKTTKKEFKSREEFHKYSKKDLFVSFKSFFQVKKLHQTHFQIHKNLVFLDSLGLLIYPTKQNTLDIFNPESISSIALTQMMNYNDTTVVQVDNNGNEDGVLGFDSVFDENNEKIFTCIGNQSGQGSLVINSLSEVNRCFDIPDKEGICAKNEGKYLIDNSGKVNNTNNNNNEFLLEDYVNAVRIIDNNIITSNNAGFIQKYDLEKYKYLEKGLTKKQSISNSISNIRSTSNANTSIKDKEKQYEKEHLTSYDSIKSSNPINHFDISRDGNVLVCVGDMKQVEVWDYKNKISICNLNEHRDYGMACRIQCNNAFSKNKRFYNGSNHIIATSNQDGTTKIWDLRNSSKSLKTLYGVVKTISDVQFINENKIVSLESQDHFHIYDLCQDTLQTISYFGNANGLAIEIINSTDYRIFLGVVCEEFSGIFKYDMIA